MNILFFYATEIKQQAPCIPFHHPSTPHTFLSSPHSAGRHFLHHDSAGEDLHCGPHQLLRHTCVLQTNQLKKLMILTNNLTLKLITNLFILCCTNPSKVTPVTKPNLLKKLLRTIFYSQTWGKYLDSSRI
jgi:hypothetical protein